MTDELDITVTISTEQQIAMTMQTGQDIAVIFTNPISTGGGSGSGSAGTSGTSGSSSFTSLFEVNPEGDIEPVNIITTDQYYELDGSDNIMPKV